MEIVIIILGCLILYVLWRIYQKLEWLGDNFISWYEQWKDIKYKNKDLK